jgi:hypothetical protein
MAPPARPSTPEGAAEMLPPGPVERPADRRRGWQRTADRWTSLMAQAAAMEGGSGTKLLWFWIARP